MKLDFEVVKGVPFTYYDPDRRRESIHPSIYKGYRKPFYQKIESDEGTVYKSTDPMSAEISYENSRGSAERNILNIQSEYINAIKMIAVSWGFSNRDDDNDRSEELLRHRGIKSMKTEEIVDFEAGLYLLRNFSPLDLYPVINKLSDKAEETAFQDDEKSRKAVRGSKGYEHIIEVLRSVTRDYTEELYRLILDNPDTLNLSLAASLIDTDSIDSRYENIYEGMY